MQNRISYQPTAAFQQKFLDHLDALVVMSAEMVAQTNPNDLKTGQNMGSTTSVAFVRDGVAIATMHPKLVETENTTLQDYQNGLARHDFLRLVQDKQDILRTQTNQATMLTGKDLMQKTNWVLDELRKRKFMPSFKDLFERLNHLYKTRSERGDATKKLKATLGSKEMQ
jgi:hypothetical protein